MEFTPKECTQYPGFYHPIGTDLVVVSRDGRVINLRTGNEISTHPNDNGYMTLCVHIPQPDGTSTFKNFNLHRLLALAFIPIPDDLKHLRGRQLTVNHEDTNKRNNSIGNLEWLSFQNNVKHAYRNNLNSTAKTVVARNYYTHEETRYTSINECARAFDIDDQKLRTHLSTPETGTFLHNDYLFKYDDESEWPDFDDCIKPFEHHRAVIAMNVKTQLKVLDVSTKSLMQNLLLSFTGYGNHVRAKGVNVPYHDWVVKDVNLNEPLDMELFKEWEKSSNKELHHTVVSYRVTNVRTNETNIVHGIKALMKQISYTAGSISNAFENNNGYLGDYLLQKLGRAKLLTDKV